MDFKQRSEWEGTLSRKLEKLGTKQRAEILRLLGDPPKLERITPEYWERHKKELQSVIVLLEDVYLQSAANFIGSQPAFGVDWSLVNSAASDWVRGYWTAGGSPDPQYPFALVARFTERRKRKLGENVALFFEEGWNMGQLRKELDGLFGAAWGELVAPTEVTRAAAEGELEVVRELKE